MDPFSITAGSIAVITAAGTAVKGIRKLAEYRKYHRELDSLIQELDAAEAVIRKINDYFAANSHAPYCEDLLDSLAAAGAKFETLQSMFLRKSSEDGPSPSYRDRLKWLLNKNTIISLRDDIRMVRFNLLLQLSLMGT